MFESLIESQNIVALNGRQRYQLKNTKFVLTSNEDEYNDFLSSCSIKCRLTCAEQENLRGSGMGYGK